MGLLVLTWHNVGWEVSYICDSSIPVSLWNSHILTRVGYSCSVTVLIQLPTGMSHPHLSGISLFSGYSHSSPYCPM